MNGWNDPGRQTNIQIQNSAGLNIEASLRMRRKIWKNVSLPSVTGNRATAAASLKRHLEECLLDVGLSELTTIYTDDAEGDLQGWPRQYKNTESGGMQGSVSWEEWKPYAASGEGGDRCAGERYQSKNKSTLFSTGNTFKNVFVHSSDAESLKSRCYLWCRDPALLLRISLHEKAPELQISSMYATVHGICGYSCTAVLPGIKKNEQKTEKMCWQKIFHVLIFKSSPRR